jgi:hypothetical protein
MPGLVFDQVGERRYETGVDRGVIFLPDGNVVAWNGLTSVTESRSKEVKNYYIDGIQYLAHPVLGGYAAKVTAFTYPDELDMITGLARAFQDGVYLNDQRVQMFNFSYRTLLGNDIEGTDYGYRIHIVWNVVATPSDQTYDSISDSLEPAPFEWNLVAVPQPMLMARSSAHISIDSRKVDPGLLRDIELSLYGEGDLYSPGLPPMLDFLSWLQSWGGIIS